MTTLQTLTIIRALVSSPTNSTSSMVDKNSVFYTRMARTAQTRRHTQAEMALLAEAVRLIGLPALLKAWGVKTVPAGVHMRTVDRTTVALPTKPTLGLPPSRSVVIQGPHPFDKVFNPVPVRLSKKARRAIGQFDKWIFPVISNMAENEVIDELMLVQPMPIPKGKPVMPFTIVHPRPTHKVTCRRCKYWKLLPRGCKQEVVRGHLADHYEATDGLPLEFPYYMALCWWELDHPGCVFVYYNDIQVLSGRSEYVAVERDKIIDRYLIAMS